MLKLKLITMKLLLCTLVALIIMVLAINTHYFIKYNHKWQAWIAAVTVAVVCGWVLEGIGEGLMNN